MTDPASPASPCTGRCTLDPVRPHCLGCQRSLAEIAAGPGAAAVARQAILATVAERQRRSTAAAQSAHAQQVHATDRAEFTTWC